VSFVGRLAEYRYYNMDQVVASALRAFEDIAKDWTRFERIA
jgi:UDP-galactopyranose mutase